MTAWLLAGLGNPGPQYERTRHNAGFWFLEALARLQGAQLRTEKTHHCLSARIALAGVETHLCLPQQYMNHSGQAVSSMARYYHIPLERILVIHDELDLPAGVARLKQGGGHGGHNGLKDIDAHLGSRDYLRLRLGIGHPGQRDLVVSYVLHHPSLADQQHIENAIAQAMGILPTVLQGQLQAAMNTLHQI